MCNWIKWGNFLHCYQSSFPFWVNGLKAVKEYLQYGMQWDISFFKIFRGREPVHQTTSNDQCFSSENHQIMKYVLQWISNALGNSFSLTFVEKKISIFEFISQIYLSYFIAICAATASSCQSCFFPTLLAPARTP